MYQVRQRPILWFADFRCGLNEYSAFPERCGSAFYCFAANGRNEPTLPMHYNDGTVENRKNRALLIQQ